jgi:hypothetical protein
MAKTTERRWSATTKKPVRLPVELTGLLQKIWRSAMSAREERRGGINEILSFTPSS